MLVGEQEIRRGFLKKMKLAKTKPYKQCTLNRAKMLEHHIQHRTRIFVLAIMKPTQIPNNLPLWQIFG